MPANPDNFLEDLADEIAGRLNSLPFFADITVRAEQDGTVTEMMAKAMDGTLRKAGKAGVAIVVQFPEVVRDEDQGPAGALLKVQVAIEIYENAKVNRLASVGTGKKRGAVAAEVLRSLKGYASAWLGMTQAVCTEGTVIRGEMAADQQLRLMMRFVTQWPMTFPSKVLLPDYDLTVEDDGTRAVTLLCNTAGAALWYTRSGGGYPSPVNAQALLYTVPLSYAADASDELRVMAYKDGLLPSDEIAVEIDAAPEAEGNIMLREDGEPLLREDGTPMLREDP